MAAEVAGTVIIGGMIIGGTITGIGIGAIGIGMTGGMVIGGTSLLFFACFFLVWRSACVCGRWSSCGVILTSCCERVV